MNRQDAGLAFLLQYENIAWFDGNAVRILDRRVYPWKEDYVICETPEAIAQAIRDMVTQSGGPYFAAAMGMVLAVHLAQQKKLNLEAYVSEAAYTLSHARPTTVAKMEAVVNGSLKAIREALANQKDPLQAAFDFALANINNRYANTHKIAEHLVPLFPDKGVVMTQCFAETILGMMSIEIQKLGKQISFICPETRPYLQGARLTASVLSDMGHEVHVVTDNMPGYILKRNKVDVFTSAADVICMDGHVVNKVGTFQIALAANFWGIPYFVTGTPNSSHPTVDTVEIEERDHEQVTNIFGTRVVKEKVLAYYPAFDITPPQLCSGVATPKGIYSPYDLKRYFA
ncbi:MAG: s-methyl-5-thioribose-1-phosphate isomerase [Anaerolineaceae bacterium]|nr:s-methyl-5-thioribose-1-phosphate isomerase [Anaerolineaceae bacterium]